MLDPSTVWSYDGAFSKHLPVHLLQRCNQAFDINGIGKAFTIDAEGQSEQGQRFSIFKIFAPCVLPLDVNHLIWVDMDMFWVSVDMFWDGSL